MPYEIRKIFNTRCYTYIVLNKLIKTLVSKNLKSGKQTTLFITWIICKNIYYRMERATHG